MKRKIISDAVTNISDKHIAEAADYAVKTKKKARIWLRWGAVAACLCLVIGIFIWQSQPQQSEQPGIVVDENGVTIPQINVSFGSNSEADMIPFFIYQGRVYVHDEFLYNADSLIGDYLGTSIGTIDEWTAKDGYVDFAGSVKGDFYSVNGYAPSFMLCMKNEDNSIATYVNNNGITLKYGSELFEERLHLSENYASVKYQTRYDWYNSIGEPIPLEGHTEEVESFVEALKTAEFMRLSDIPLEEGETSVYDSKEIYHLFFEMENGMVIHLRLFEGGYVNFDGINGVCVKMDEKVFENLVKVLDS
ncbi:MAG: hypothetical protein IJZ53_04445 [Tyzzerella sp.]|nr:hypothetical protein [Tyzzerella sp.]